MGRKGKKEPSLIEQGFHVLMGTLQNYGRKYPVSNITLRSNSINLFGDESSSRHYVTYALVVLDELSTIELEERWSGILFKYGSLDGRGFHARKLFHLHARQKSQWLELDLAEAWRMTHELTDAIVSSGASVYLGIVHRETFPTEMNLGNSRTTRLLDAHLFPFGYLAAVQSAREEGILTIPGTEVRLWTDQVDTIELWGVGNIQVKRLMSQSGIEPEPIFDGAKELLIEAADLIAYAAGRALDVEQSKNKENCLEVMRRLNVSFCQYYWCVNEKSTELMDRLNHCSFLGRDF